MKREASGKVKWVLFGVLVLLGLVFAVNGLQINSQGVVDFKDASGSNAFYVSPDGKVGIGTTSPTEKLDVNGYIRTPAKIIGDMFVDVGDGSYYLNSNDYSRMKGLIVDEVIQGSIGGNAATADMCSNLATGTYNWDADAQRNVRVDYASNAGIAATATQAQSVLWSGIDEIPAGFADGVDNVGGGSGGGTPNCELVGRSGQTGANSWYDSGSLCGSGEFMTAGGGSCDAENVYLQASMPSGTNSWTVHCSGADVPVRVKVICCSFV